jgi:hypothetical protein
MQIRLFDIFFIEFEKSTKAVALQLYYFSIVSASRPIIQHGQAQLYAREVSAQLFGCTVCPCRMVGSVAGILGYLIKLLILF